MNLSVILFRVIVVIIKWLINDGPKECQCKTAYRKCLKVPPEQVSDVIGTSIKTDHNVVM